jgi:hypothetical protein
MATGVPSAVSPLYTATVTGVVSLAVPLKDGAVFFDGEVGCSSVTVGASVPMVNVEEGVNLI